MQASVPGHGSAALQSVQLAAECTDACRRAEGAAPHRLAGRGQPGLIVRNSLAVHGGQQQATVRHAPNCAAVPATGARLAATSTTPSPAAASTTSVPCMPSANWAITSFAPATSCPPSRAFAPAPRAGYAERYGAGPDVRILGRAAGRYAKPQCLSVYVTASGEGVVEIYRDGNLLSTQAVKPGIQEIHTRRLPGGIYDVELRVVQDGREASRESASIHKPSRWQDPSRRWRQRIRRAAARAAGQRRKHPRGRCRGGCRGQYLLHSRAVAGATVQRIGARHAAGVSMDWQASDRFSTYTNVSYQRRRARRGPAGPVPLSCRLGGGQPCARLGGAARARRGRRQRRPTLGDPRRLAGHNGRLDHASFRAP